jgi:hypothetical protein
VIAGVVLRWIDLFSANDCDDGVSAAPIFIRITTVVDKGDEDILVDSFKVCVSDLVCTIPFHPCAVRQLLITRIQPDGSNVTSLLSAKCFLLEVPMRCERIQMIAKTSQAPPSSVPVHLRIDPAQFAEQLLQRQVSASLPKDIMSSGLTTSSSHTLSRSGAEYHLALSQRSSDSDARLLTRICTTVYAASAESHSKQALVSQRAVLSYRNLANAWVVCTESYVSESLVLDFVWDSVPTNPPPILWKIEFVHARAAIRWLDLHFLNSATISSLDGFKEARQWSRLASTSPHHHSTVSKTCGSLIYNGPPQRTSTVTLSIPPTAPAIGGVHLELDSQHPSTETVFITAYDMKRGERVLLWSGSPQSTELLARWAPTRSAEISICNLRSTIGYCKVLLPSSLPLAVPNPTKDAMWSLHHGVNDLPIPSFPTFIPLAIGATLNFTGSASHPLVLASMRVKSSESKLQFQISCLSADGITFTPVGWVETMANQWSQARFSSYTGLPTQWRLTCCSCGTRSDSQATELAYVSLAVDPVFAASVQPTAPVDLADVSCTFLTNAIARHNPTSQAALRQRFLSKVHSTDSSPLQPYLRFGNFDNAIGGNGGDDWEKRSQVSSSSGGGMSSAPFIFVLLDLRTQPRAFSAIEMNVQTDTRFELEVQWSNDNNTFNTAAVHQQGNGRWSSSWANQGAHPFWRAVVSFAQLAGRSKKRSQASNIGGDVDEKMLIPFIRAVSLCAVERIVWSEVDHAAPHNNSVAISCDELIAIRRQHESDPRVLHGLNPLRRVSIPLGLRIPTGPRADTLLFEADVHPQDFEAKNVGSLMPSIFALWRAAIAKPSQSMNRVAIAAEDELQSALPQIINPQSVLDKESAAQISRIFFGGVDFELTDASLSRQINRITSEPSVVIRGTSVSGVRGIPPGTRLVLCFEWTNISLIPSQPQMFVRSMMVMDRTWLAIQSEFTSIDSFCRLLPSIRDTVFSDLCLYTVIYMVSKDDVHVGGHYPPLVGLDTRDSFEALLSHGVNVVASHVPSSAVVQLFRKIGGPAQNVSLFVEALVGSSSCTVTLHSNFESASGVRLVIAVHQTHNFDCEGLLQLRALSFIVSWNAPGSITIECLGDVHIPRWTNDAPFSVHSTLFEGEFSRADTDASQPIQSYVMALACSDEQYLSQLLFGQHSSIGLRSIVGIAHVAISSEGQCVSPPRVALENLSFHANLRFTSTLQIPCVLWPQRNDASSIVLQTSPSRISRFQMRNFVAVEFERVRSNLGGTNSGLPDGFGDFFGTCRAVLSLKSASTVLEHFGTASWSGSPQLPTILSFNTSNDGPLLRVQVSVPPRVLCCWHDDISLHASDGRLDFSISPLIHRQGGCLVRGFFSSSSSTIANSFHVTTFNASANNSFANAVINVDVSIRNRCIELQGCASTNSIEGQREIWSPQQLVVLKDIIAESVVRNLPDHLVGLNSVIPFFDGGWIRWQCSGRLCGTPFAISVYCNDAKADVVEKLCASIMWHTALKNISLPVQRTS